jgi:histidinol-phosphate/aromatic aminotransferase/cobyric acid decarboxylase-like protein/choline kinase
MQALFLAAGMGKRLGPLTAHSTKCMVPFDGKRLIEHALDALLESPIRKVVLVVGHGGDELISHLGPAYKGLPLEYVWNRDYATTNNIYSLFLVREHLAADDTLLLESDVVFEPSIIRESLAHPAPNVAIVAKHEPWMDGTVVTLKDGQHISSFISKKDFSWEEAGRYFKTVNIYKLSRDFSRSKFLPFLEAYINAQGKNGFYEEVLKLLAFIDTGDLVALPVVGKLWYEIDDLQDLDIAHVLFAPPGARLPLLQQRYGGYWRFPRLKDFCYLVNPFFPPPRLVDELKQNFGTLLTSYPSGQNVQNLLAAKLFGCAPDRILVGNGASELIGGMVPRLGGRVGMAVPTFNEYYERLGDAEFVPHFSASPDFAYSAEDLVRFCERERLKTLVLINPDNPTGHYLPKPEVLRLLEALAASGVRLILDESFVDFADGTAQGSLLDDGILAAHPRLVVIKSLGKSYGVAGIRLGVMATADADLLRATRKSLAIWNINAPGEYFLQVIGKYAGDYLRSCARVVTERERLLRGLSSLPWLRPLPSAANFIFCETGGGKRSDELTAELLDRFLILIKDCRGKKGVGDRSFVRFTVRGPEDNDRLLEALKAVGPA